MSTNQPETEAPAADSRFLNLMQQHRGGEALNEMSAALREVVMAAQLTGKTATVTMKFTVKQAAKIRGAVTIEDSIAIKLPQLPKDNSLFYANEQGDLQREDPKQMKLKLRVIEAPAISEQGAETLRKVGAL